MDENGIKNLNPFFNQFGGMSDDQMNHLVKILEEYKPCADRIKQRNIASYLGITPETLSRIRSASI
jgi:CRP-like cAMP-binding protein